MTEKQISLLKKIWQHTGPSFQPHAYAVTAVCYIPMYNERGENTNPDRNAWHGSVDIDGVSYRLSGQNNDDNVTIRNTATGETFTFNRILFAKEHFPNYYNSLENIHEYL